MGAQLPISDSQKRGRLAALYQMAIRDPRLTSLFVLGAFSLLLSYAIEASLELAQEHIRYILSSGVLFWWKVLVWVLHFFAVLLRDVGFAFLIAFVLGLLVERVAREEQAALIKGAIEKIRENVLESTYSVKTPNPLVKLVLQTVLSAQIVRDSYRADYVLAPLENHPNFMLLKVDIDSVIRNVGAEPYSHKIRLNLPLRVEEEFRAISKLLGGAIGTETLDASLIKVGDDAAPDSDYEHRYQWERTILPDSTLRVMFSFHLVKEKSANEVWTSLLPCERLEMSVISQCPDIEWNVDPLFSGNLNPLDGARKGPHTNLPTAIRYSAGTPLLPHQGIVLWWRRAAPARRVSVADANGPLPEP